MDAENLFQSVQLAFPAALPEGSWYIVIASVLVALNRSDALVDLYIHLTSLPEWQTLEQRKTLSRRLKDVLMKEWTLVGIPLVISAVTALAGAEKQVGVWSEEEAEYWLGDGEAEGEYGEGSAELTKGDIENIIARAHVTIDKETTTRGTTTLRTLYAHNLAPIFRTFGPIHGPDFAWLERSVIYGLFLSDHTVLTPIEAELVVLCSIMVQGLRAPTLWHLRGTRRLGVSCEDVEGVQSAVGRVARWCGVSEDVVNGWARVDDVEGDV